MNCTEEIVQLTNDVQKEFDEFGEVTFETKQRLNEILKDENKRDEYRKSYQNSEGNWKIKGIITSLHWKNTHWLTLISPPKTNPHILVKQTDWCYTYQVILNQRIGNQVKHILTITLSQLFLTSRLFSEKRLKKCVTINGCGKNSEIPLWEG